MILNSPIHPDCVDKEILGNALPITLNMRDDKNRHGNEQSERNRE